jgi:hypothetical protein
VLSVRPRHSTGKSRRVIENDVREGAFGAMRRLPPTSSRGPVRAASSRGHRLRRRGKGYVQDGRLSGKEGGIDLDVTVRSPSDGLFPSSSANPLNKRCSHSLFQEAI